MKKIIIGIVILIISTLSNISILIATSLIASNMKEWKTDDGKFMTALSTYGLLLPYIVTCIFVILGILILAKEYFSIENK